MGQLVPHENKEDTKNHIIAYLRRTPAIRTVLYLGTSAAILEAVVRLQDWDKPYATERMYVTTLAPVITALTYSFISLRPQDRAQWTQHSVRQQVVRAGQGVGLGATAILSFFAIAAARGWVSAPTWGWERTDPAVVGRSVAIMAIGHLAVAWTEEVIFRGYGYDTLRLALPHSVAATIITALFAYGHPPGLQVKIGEAALGVALLVLRDASNGIAAPIGYHWAWNFFQSGFFGPVESVPSLRPQHNHGPHLWLGRPGYPEPGLLSTVVNLAVGVGIGTWLYLQRRKRKASHPHSSG